MTSKSTTESKAADRLDNMFESFCEGDESFPVMPTEAELAAAKAQEQSIEVAGATPECEEASPEHIAALKALLKLI